MSEVCVKLPNLLEKEADLYVKSGLYSSRGELMIEAVRYYLRNALKANVDVAIKMYKSGEISLGRAAEIAGVGYEDMRQILHGRGIKIKIGPENVSEANEELENIRKNIR